MVINLVNRAASAGSALGLWVSAGLLVYIVIHVNLEIVLRSFFGSSTNSMGEFVGYAIGALAIWTLVPQTVPAA